MSRRHVILPRNWQPVVCLETGARYPSIESAARAVGVAHNVIHQSVTLGCAARGRHFRRLSFNGNPVPPERTPSRRRRIPITIGGHPFEHMVQAGRHFRVSSETVRRWLKQGYMLRKGMKIEVRRVVANISERREVAA